MNKVSISIVFFVSIFLSKTSFGACHGKFINPVTDICWECVMPITIAGVTWNKGKVPRKRDTNNPRNPVCMCTKNNILIPGITIGFWEPVRLADITRTPYCMVNLGGMQLSTDNLKIGGHSHKYDRKNNHTSFYHLHYYM
ncbi:MAG: hypothetical protein DGJ47_000898, partial [Rickettsiaceae bacterium]